VLAGVSGGMAGRGGEGRWGTEGEGRGLTAKNANDAKEGPDGGGGTRMVMAKRPKM
jgi:hypothetical protein